jgi:hypothetical protein
MQTCLRRYVDYLAGPLLLHWDARCLAAQYAASQVSIHDVPVIFLRSRGRVCGWRPAAGPLYYPVHDMRELAYLHLLRSQRVGSKSSSGFKHGNDVLYGSVRLYVMSTCQYVAAVPCCQSYDALHFRNDITRSP